MSSLRLLGLGRVLRLTPQLGGCTGIEISEGQGAGPVVVRPFNDSGGPDSDLYLFGLGAGVVYVNGDVPATASGLSSLDARVVAIETDAELAAIAGLTSAANKGIRFTGAGTAATFDLSLFALTLLDDPDAATMRTTLGLGSLATQSGTFSGTSSGTNTGDQTITLTGGVTGSGTGSFAATVVTNANLTGPITSVGNATTIADAELAAIAGLTSAADSVPYFTGSGTAALATVTSAARSVLDDTSVSAMVDTLGGASSTGTGGLARRDSPSFTGTPTAGPAGGITRRILTHWSRTVRSWLSDPATATTITNLGFVAAPTVLGTQSSSPGTNRDFDAFTTAGASGDTGGIISAAFTYTRRAYEPTLVQAIRTQASIADVRIWVGFFGASPTGSSTAPANTAAFRYDTGVDGTAFWRTVTSDATTPNVTTTTAPIATATEYVLRVEMSASTVEFFVDDVLVATHSSNLPVSTTTVGLGATITALTAAAKGLRWAWTHLIQN